MTKRSMNDIWEHIEVTNEEMGKVKTDVECLKTDVGWIKETCDEFNKKLDKVDERTWWILGTVIVMSLLAIAVTLITR